MSLSFPRQGFSTLCQPHSPKRKKKKKSYLEAEQSYSVYDIVLSVSSRGWQDWGEVIDRQQEEEQETQKVAPDVHRLIRQHKNTVPEKKKQRLNVLWHAGFLHKHDYSSLPWTKKKKETRVEYFK